MDPIPEIQNMSLVLRTNPNKTPATFNDLPPEVRNRIYHLVVSFRNKDGTRKALKPKEFQMRYQNLLPKLLLSRQVLCDMLPILLGNNVIHLNARPGHRIGGAFVSEGRNVIKYAHIHYPISKRAGIESHFFYEFEMPPSRLRPFFKHIKITFEAPMFSKNNVRELVERDVGDDERPWSMAEFDWLYPLRELQKLGFGRLEELQVVIESGRFQYCTLQERWQMETWAGSRLWEMRAMNVIDAKILEFEFDPH